MCLKLDEISKTRTKAKELTKKPLIAKTNITTYKVLDRIIEHKNAVPEYISPYRNCVYEPGEIKSAAKFSFYFIDICGWRTEVRRGIHSYNKDAAIQLWNRNKGFKTLKAYSRILIKCVIPKGTPYFKNKNGEFVSLILKTPKEYLNIWNEVVNQYVVKNK